MAKKLQIDKLLAANPKVDKIAVKEARRQIDNLRKAGIIEKGYDLIPPFSSRPYMSKKAQNQ